MSVVKKRTKKTIVGNPKTEVEKRNRLAELLTIAAQLEHDVMVQYLFAAASLKKTIAEGGVTYGQLEIMRKWSTNMMMVARQEMEHLGYACNLLTAIGEAPVLRRPSFPIAANVYPTNLVSSLDKFSLETVLRFVCYEMPNKVEGDVAKVLREAIPGFKPSDYDGIYRTYMEIEQLFQDIKDTDLFIGPPGAEFLSGGNSIVARGRVFPEGNTGKPPPIYDIELLPVTNLETAKHAIRQIVEEGEGAKETSTTSHFARFFEMYVELKEELKNDPKFQPARYVGSNPRVSDGKPAISGITYVTNSDTIRVMQVFDQAYVTMLLMLMRYFAHTDETEDDLIGLQNTVFFPMMTMGIRPLTEVLTQLPAYTPPSALRAGPSFIIPKDVQLLPHRQSAWRVILGELQLLTELAQGVTTIKSFPQPIRDRLIFVYESFARMTMNFQDAMHAREMK